MSEAVRSTDTRAACAPLGIKLPPEARERIESFLASFTTFSPTLGLLYGYAPGAADCPGSWSMVAFGPQTVADLEASYASFGATVRFDLDGIEVLVPQLGHIAELQRGKLYFDGDRLFVDSSEAHR